MFDKIYLYIIYNIWDWDKINHYTFQLPIILLFIIGN